MRRQFALVALLTCMAASSAAACPFCTALAPTLVQRRESAAVAAVGELIETTADRRVFRLHKVLSGQSLLRDEKTLSLPRSTPSRLQKTLRTV